MANVKLLQDNLAKIQINMVNGGDVFKHIFTAHPELRSFYGVEDIDPDDVSKSRQVQQKGASVLMRLSSLVKSLGNEKDLKSELKEDVEFFKDSGLKPGDVKKFAPGIISFLDEKAGKLSDAQRKEWKSFYDKFEALLKANGL